MCSKLREKKCQGIETFLKGPILFHQALPGPLVVMQQIWNGAYVSLTE